MIIVHGLIPILPERRSEALKLIRWMERETQAEAGCLTYRFFVGLNVPNTLMLFQEWDSAEALEAHFETAHMASFLEALPTIVAGDIQTRRYAVALDEGDDEGVWDEEESLLDDAEVGAPPIIH
jgi:quinol monooxygenase YgiN